MQETVVLTESTNAHVLKGEVTFKKVFEDGSTYVETKGAYLVHEGKEDASLRHHDILLNGGKPAKAYFFNQEELNPVTRSLQKAFD